ncbi:MAG: hypothetical protein PHT07_10050 [Paludibacter sp.]|nr:hypothetical protein [Paludibacter sp.]
MAKNRSDSYHEIEGAQAGKALLKRDQKNWYWIIFMLASFFVMMSVYRVNDITKEMFFSVYGDAAFASTNFKYGLYFYISAFLLFVFYGIMIPDSYSKKMREKKVIQQKKGKLSDIDKAELWLYKNLDKAFYYGLYPLSILTLSAIPEEDKEKIYFRWGWHSHVEKEFFRQEFREVDGYQRVQTLKLLKDFEQFFTRQKGDKAKLSKEYQFISWLFKSEAEMIDLMKISEGFIAADKEHMKYDKLLTASEFTKRLNDAGGSIDNMRMFNGKNEVSFSPDLMKYLIDDEAARFEAYIREYAFDARMLFTRRFRRFEAALKKDIHLKTYLFPKHIRQEQYESIINDEEKLRNYLIFAITCYFRLMLFKMIIGQYVNLPAGVVVVKLRDYTARMITEIFEDHSLVNIIKDKNDGTNTEFESDNLTNLFLASVNHYRVSSPESYEDRILKIFNFIPSAPEETSDKIASEISEALNEDWVAQMAEMMTNETSGR